MKSQEYRPLDRRIRKSRAAIHRAFLELMREKPLSKITVSELTARADVNRKTFYNHYSDISDVLEELENDCVIRVTAGFQPEDIRRYIDDPALFFARMITELKNNGDLYKALYQTNDHYRLVGKIVVRQKELLAGLLNIPRASELWIDYFLNFIAFGTLSVITIWFRQEEDVPIETLAEFFNALLSSGDIHKVLERLSSLSE